MPNYLYRCPCGDREIIHSMKQETAVICENGHTMHRVPQLTRVNWVGLKELAPVTKNWLADLPRLRDEFAAKKETHVERTNYQNQ
jgi:hypothetical protein